MKPKKDTSAVCVVRASVVNQVDAAIISDHSTDELDECTVIESMRKLMALGLSAREIEELDIRQPTLQAICEYARFDEPGRNDSERASDMVGATLNIIGDQMRSLDLEIEMLNLRKRALKRRTQILEKLSRALESGDDNILAA
ncbi:MAG: hypothetical protein M1133_13470 [Armatimonadetes bacterium]|nr:hypothetical protein [Armatimonadota bacterium]